MFKVLRVKRLVVAGRPVIVDENGFVCRRFLTKQREFTMKRKVCAFASLFLLMFASVVAIAQAKPAEKPPVPADEPKMCPMMEMMHKMKAEAAPETRIPLINDVAPAFTAETTQGPIRFPEDYKGKWVVLFSHPADFTPVCTTEFMTFASLANEFKALNTELIGLSIDSTYSHIAWLRTIKEKIEYKGMKNVEVNFPVISDIKMDVAKKYGMVQPNASGTQAVRAVFFIDPDSKIRALIYYPLSNGRNFAEILRLLKAMQASDKYKIATPADWQPGDDVIVPPPGSCGTAKERVANQGKDYRCLDWFLCFKSLKP
jgi:peroxiredoxin (alkyl hydroperoxide reductase subunit C)